MPYPSSMRFICTIMEKFRLIRHHPGIGLSHPSVTGWQLRSRLCSAQHVLMILFLGLHFLSTVGRSCRYLPEFFQKFYEDCTFLLGYMGPLLFYLHYSEIASLLNNMERSFSRVDSKIAARCDRKVKILFYGYFTIVFIVLLVNFFEKLFPLPEQELETMRYIYRTQDPNRRMYFNIWIPFIDESAPGYYEVIYILELYPIMLIILGAMVIIQFLPLIIVDLEGQYDMLCIFMEKIGHEHRDPQGKLIYYIDIETNEHVYADTGTTSCDTGPAYNQYHEQVGSNNRKNESAGSRLPADYDNIYQIGRNSYRLARNRGTLGQKLELFRDENIKLSDLIRPNHNARGKPARMFPSHQTGENVKPEELKAQYEHMYVRQLIKFHQKLNRFESKMTSLFSNTMFLIVCLDSILLCICLYQLTLPNHTLSPFRFNKFVSEFFAATTEYYYLCHCSDTLDDCAAKLRTSLYNSAWYNCSAPTKRNLVIMMRRLQRPNQLKFNEGALVLSKGFFVKVTKLAYSFVNFMRLKGT